MRSTFALVFLLLVPQAVDAQQSPYAGLETRPIKALAPERVAALLAGEGAGYALAAELNGYPGPRHVLDLADSLALTDEQRVKVTEVFQEMQRTAQQLGRRLVAGEAALDSAFQSGTIGADGLERFVTELAQLEGQLRAAHLAAHLDVTAILTRHQVREYGRLRGYGHGGEHQHRETDHRPEP